MWSNKDIDAIEAALDGDRSAARRLRRRADGAAHRSGRHAEFLDGLKRSIDIAQRLGATVLIAQAGADLAGPDAVPSSARRSSLPAKAADMLAGSGVVLAVEPLNTLVDHVGYFLPSTVEGLDIIDEVGRPEIRILYDIYHSAVMDEDIAEVLDGRLDRVAHAHLADAPGRHEPGTGTLDWQARVAWLEANGYTGMVGLEYKPTTETAASLAALLGR